MNNKKSLILIDASNLYYGFINYNWELNYVKFYRWLHKNFAPIGIYFFDGTMTQKTFFEKYPNYTLQDFILHKDKENDFFKMLKHVGYKIRTKPVASVYDKTSGDYKRKCNFDVEITILALDLLNDYDELVLCSGDGDFIKLLKYVKGKFKKTMIIAHKDRTNQELKKTANSAISIESIRSEIGRNKRLP